MQNVICSGWLLKTGGDGHNYKNTKRRWFELKGMYLFYFSEQPKEAKEMKVVKGIIFLPGCQIKHELDQQRLYFRTSGGKVYYFSLDSSDEAFEEGEETHHKSLSTKSSTSRHNGGDQEAPMSRASAKLQSWAKAIEYAMESARGFKDIKVAEGNWLHKRGGKSHGYVNWKKRRFALRGNLMLYYSEDPELFDVFRYLKGFIDLASITSIDARQNPDDQIDKPHYFKLTVDNEREFFISAQSIEQKTGWMKAIRKQTKNLADRLNYPNLRSIQKTEKVQVSGELLRVKSTKGDADLHGSSEKLKTYVVLTSLKLRYYETEADLDVQSFGSKMIGSIPLLGCGTQLEDDRITMTLHDLQGHRFTFIAKSPEDAEQWMLAIRTASRVLITSVLAKQISISLNTHAVGKRGEELGYTIAKLDSTALTIITLLLEKEKRLEWDEINKVSLKNQTFSLKYTRRRTGVSKVIEFRSPNAIAFFDTISCVMSLRDDIAAKQKKMKAKGKDTDPAKVVRRSNSSKAIPIGPKMVQTRSNDASSSSALPAADSASTSAHSKESSSTMAQNTSHASPARIKIKSSGDTRIADSSPQTSPGASARKKKELSSVSSTPLSSNSSTSSNPTSPTSNSKSKSKTKMTTLMASEEDAGAKPALTHDSPMISPTASSKPKKSKTAESETFPSPADEEQKLAHKQAKKIETQSDIQERSDAVSPTKTKNKRNTNKTAVSSKAEPSDTEAKPFAKKIDKLTPSPTPKRKAAPKKTRTQQNSVSASSSEDDDSGQEDSPIVIRKTPKREDAIEVSKISAPIAIKDDDEDSSSRSESSSDESSS